MYVRMLVCMFVCMYVWMHVCMYVCMYGATAWFGGCLTYVLWAVTFQPSLMHEGPANICALVCVHCKCVCVLLLLIASRGDTGKRWRDAETLLSAWTQRTQWMGKFFLAPLLPQRERWTFGLLLSSCSVCLVVILFFGYLSIVISSTFSLGLQPWLAALLSTYFCLSFTSEFYKWLLQVICTMDVQEEFSNEFHNWVLYVYFTNGFYKWITQ